MPQEDTNPTPTTPTAGEPEAGGTPGETPNGSEPQEEEVQDVKKLPKWAQDQLAKANSEARERRIALKKQEDDAKAKEQTDLAAKQEWEKLANTYKGELATLKPKVEEATQLNELLAERINADIKAWPKEITDTAPEGEVSAVEMARWASKMRPVAEKLMSLNTTTTTTEKPKPKGGNGPGPTPSGSGTGAPTPPPTGTDVNDEADAIARRF